MDLELLRANLVRTLVPLIVGALVSLLPALRGMDQVATLIGFGVSAAYYAVFRIAETRFPWVGVFLGKRMVHGSPAHGHSGSAASSLMGAPTGSASETVSIRVNGIEVPKIESMAWQPSTDGPPVLSLNIRDPQVEFYAPGSASAAAPSARRAPAAPLPKPRQHHSSSK